MYRNFIFMFFIVGGPETDNPTTEDPGYAATSTEAAPTTQPPTTGKYAELYKNKYCFALKYLLICKYASQYINPYLRRSRKRRQGVLVEM